MRHQYAHMYRRPAAHTSETCARWRRCVASPVDGCESNPFATSIWPYLLGLLTLFSSGGSLLILAYALRSCEATAPLHAARADAAPSTKPTARRAPQALMAITVFEGCMIISGAASGNVVLDEISALSPIGLYAYGASVAVILGGLGVLLHGELGPKPELEASLL